MKKLLSYIFLGLLFGGFVFGADSSGESAGVSAYAYEIGKVFNLPLTNAILTTWIVSIAFILLVRFTVGKPGLIPNKAQLVFESLIESLKGLLEPILGKKAFDIAFPLLLGFFVFILINNWSGIFPGIGVFGFQEVIGDEKGPIKYWLRPGSSDLNATLGLALIGMIAWAYICLRVSGAKFMIWELFGNKASKEETPKPIYLLLTPIFIGVGLIEMVSIAFRPVSLSFRLYGNVYGGENLLTSMTALAPWAVPVPFYFYEILVGVVQALIFTLLIAIYIGLITNHGEDH